MRGMERDEKGWRGSKGLLLRERDGKGRKRKDKKRERREEGEGEKEERRGACPSNEKIVPAPLHYLCFWDTTYDELSNRVKCRYSRYVKTHRAPSQIVCAAPIAYVRWWSQQVSSDCTSLFCQHRRHRHIHHQLYHLHRCSCQLLGFEPPYTLPVIIAN